MYSIDSPSKGHRIRFALIGIAGKHCEAHRHLGIRTALVTVSERNSTHLSTLIKQTDLARFGICRKMATDRATPSTRYCAAA
jgi:hypothetical protein